jgi:hypothetical protein
VEELGMGSNSARTLGHFDDQVSHHLVDFFKVVAHLEIGCLERRVSASASEASSQHGTELTEE